MLYVLLCYHTILGIDFFTIWITQENFYYKKYDSNQNLYINSTNAVNRLFPLADLENVYLEYLYSTL